MCIYKYIILAIIYKYTIILIIYMPNRWPPEVSTPLVQCGFMAWLRLRTSSMPTISCSSSMSSGMRSARSSQSAPPTIGSSAGRNQRVLRRNASSIVLGMSAAQSSSLTACIASAVMSSG